MSNVRELIGRLRTTPGECDCTLGHEAADTIERLENEHVEKSRYIDELEQARKRLTEALETSLREWRAWMEAAADGDFVGPDSDDWNGWKKCRQVLKGDD